MPSSGGREIRAYHDATKHSVESVYQRPHHLDWSCMPRPFKVYAELEPMPLPREFPSSTRPAIEAIADPGTATGSGPPLDRVALARLLYFSAGVLKRRTYPGGEIFFRAAACTGALYHIDLYLVCGPLSDLDAGVYHFGPHDFALRRLRAGDHRRTVVDATAGEPAIAGAPAILVFTSTFWRNAWKYQSRAYRHCFWDSGTLLANLLAVAAAGSLPARVVLGFADDVMNRLLDLDVAREVTLGLVALGAGGAPAPAAPAAPALGLETLPVSSREVDYPAIREAHVVSSLDRVEDVAAWRSALLTRDGAPPAGPRLSLATSRVVAEPIEAVIRRRGSTRTFARAPIDFESLSTMLRAATRGIPADVTTTADPYLIVNAVDGLEPGAYAFDRTADALVRLAAGDLRRDAGHLALGQALAADAAVDVFWLTDLEPVLADLGNRGYRAAALAAAIEGGKAYLAAYALGIGATGLTFFDDDVIRFFSPNADGRSVMFLVAGGRPKREA